MNPRISILAAAFACSSAAAPPVPPIAQLAPLATAGLPRFTDLPNIEVTYYDVTGHGIAEIHQSVAKHAPRDPVTHAPLPTTSSWSVKVAVKSLTTGKRCKITGVTLDFHGVAVMPHLIIEKDLPAAALATWNTYVARLEARQAEQLRFVYDRIDQVKPAITGTRCDRSEAAADAALASLKNQQDLAFKRNPRTQPKLEEPSSE